MNFNFCPKCGEKFKDAFGQTDKSKMQCKNCNFVFFNNSKPTASALIVKGNKILLGKRRAEPSRGKWDIPGGFLEYKEHPRDGVKREIKEETNLDIIIKDILGIFMDQYEEHGDTFATLNIAYLAEIAGGEAKAGDDLVELKWFDVKDLPKDIAFQNGRDMLAAWKKNL